MFNEKEWKKEYRRKNKERIREYNKQYNIDNKESIKEWRKEYYIKTRERKKESNRERANQWYKDNREKALKRIYQYNKDNPEKRRILRAKYEKKRRETDLKYNLNDKMLHVIYQSLKGNKNGRSWETLVGYTVEDLTKSLKTTMPKKYTWQDYLKGKLHIDHIIPKRAFTFETAEDEEFKQCWSLYNLRLLPAGENHIKRDKITNPILLALLLKLEKPFQPALAI